MKKLKPRRLVLNNLLLLILSLSFYNHSFSQVTAGDCATATNICTNASFTIDPNGFGAVDELGDGFSTGLISNPNVNPNIVAATGFPNTGCLLSGELNSTWMIINIASNGALEFSFGVDNGANCYDWAMWQYDALACAAIQGNTLPPVACNWNGACEGFTGMAGGPNGSALPIGADQTNFEDALNVLCGEQYIVCFSNFSSAVTSVPLNFFGSATVACTTYNPITVNDETICEGTSATLTANGGLTYTWTPGTDLSATTGATVTATPPAAGSYDYYVTGTGACGTGVDTATVTVIPALDPTITQVGPYNATDPPVILNAVDAGGTWTSNCGACIDPVTGQFDPSIAGSGTWQICYTVGTAPCILDDCIDIVIDCIAPIIDPLANVSACDTYLLPLITGTNLTGNQAYYTGPGGTGTSYNPGDIISTTTTLFLFDELSPGSTCNDETSFTITIDNTPPLINCPGNLTATCDISEQPAYADYAAFTGAGGSASDETALNTGSFILLGEVSDGLSCPETVTRTYQISDACGHNSTCTQTITIHDLIAPVLAAAPGNISVQCSGGVPAMTNLGYTDNCDPAGTVAGVDVSDGLSCPETITRTWTFTDACGNMATTNQTITVQDTQAPIFPATPAGLAVQCVGDVPAMTNLGYTDNCDPAGTVTGSDVSDGLSCPETITRTWTFTDACGNVATTNQIITVQDTQAPVLNAPPTAIAVQCIGDAPAMTNLGYTDNCDPAGTVTGTDVSDGLSCPETITRSWTHTDACGNVATTVTQTITVHDTQAPVFSAAPVAVTVECIGDVPAMTNLAYTDNCDPAGIVTGTDGPLTGGPCGGTITRTWTFTDACGNTSTETQIITIDDTTPPTASSPIGISVAGIGAVPPPNPLDVIDEVDNCTANPTVAFVGDVSDNGNCPEIITRTYSITDDCGNQITVDQMITVGDPIIPTASNPIPLNVECIGDVLAPDPLVVTDETDNGAVPIVTWEDDTSDGLSCPETILRRYRVTDDCGNFIFVTQTITVNDVTPPTATAPANVNVECIGDVPAANPLDITDEADNCTANPVVAYVGDVSDGLSCPETITRTYSITDDCGNQFTVDQIITIHDVTPPTATAPANVNVECIGDVPAADVLSITNEADNCTANPVVVHVSDISDGLSCPETITRTYSITDDCGNQITVDQIIIINDITPPTAQNVTGIDVPGALDVPAPDPTVVTTEADNCTLNPVVAWISDVSDGNVCNNEQITRTYSVTDDCGNQITVTQIITILAVPPPIDAGMDLIICEGDLVTITAANPWNVPLVWSPVLPVGAFSPTQTTTYTVTADNLGCISTDDITVTVEEVPVVSFTGDNLSGCAEHTVVFTNTSTSSGIIDNCIWTFSDGTSINDCGPVSHTFTQGGLYDVTLTTISQNGCSSSDTYIDYVYVEDYPIASFIPSQTLLSIYNGEVLFSNTSVGASTYEWEFGDNSSISTEENPLHIFPSEQGGSYNVQLIATSPTLGCADTAYTVITVKEDVIYYVPNTFTPDGDDFNEFFQPIFTSGHDPYDFDLFIFNRWGEILWESHDATVGWDGTYGGKLVPTGTYTWKIEFKTTESDERILITGHVNVLK